jgi:hypothetical protein
MTAAVEREVSNSYFFSYFFDVSSMGHKSSGCKYVTSAAPRVQAKYAAELASRAAGKAILKKTEEHRSAILVRTRDLLPTHALSLLPTVIHSREHPASPCTHSSFAMRRPGHTPAHDPCVELYRLSNV